MNSSFNFKYRSSKAVADPGEGPPFSKGLDDSPRPLISRSGSGTALKKRKEEKSHLTTANISQYKRAITIMMMMMLIVIIIIYSDTIQYASTITSKWKTNITNMSHRQ